MTRWTRPFVPVGRCVDTVMRASPSVATARTPHPARRSVPDPGPALARTALLLHGPVSGIHRSPDDPGTARSVTTDPLCDTFDFDVARGLTLAFVAVYVAADDPDARLTLVRSLKPILRCADDEQRARTRTDLASLLGESDTNELWDEATSPLGGYRGTYPAFAADLRRRLGRLGVRETSSLGSFKLGASGSAHRRGASRVAGMAVPDLARTDILYFRGHHYAQYRAPGLFADGSETYGFDLRYVDWVGGFHNVKLMISTSCATLCKEAFAVFHGLFPNAVILGYRKSAPLEGRAVRDALQSKVQALGRPLLLDEQVDMTAIVAAWKSVVEERHAGNAAFLPGVYDGSTLHYWDGDVWRTVDPTDDANRCVRKADFRAQYPAPAATP